MNENDILVFAAKADGWTGWQSKHGYWNLTDGDGNKFVVCDDWEAPTFRDALLAAGYDPENDDGQALRLAVKLGLVVCVLHEIKRTGIYLPAEHIGGKYDFVECHDKDPCAATRRAIVRAAAAIGESMP